MDLCTYLLFVTGCQFSPQEQRCCLMICISDLLHNYYYLYSFYGNFVNIENKQNGAKCQEVNIYEYISN